MSDAAARLAAALSGRYRLEHQLGAGGMATVYLARDRKHDRDVAIKVLKPELAAVLGADRFIQEIKTTAALQHPNILPLFDSGSADGFLYYVMPYVEGESLREKLNRETQLGIDDAVKITTEVADALDYAHAHGVVHRDIKPENILLHAGRPMVADFGIALAVSAAAGGRMTETGMSLGTPHYMSPEQATAEKTITNRSDVYSLGAVLYELLTGQPPHTGTSAQQIIMKIVTEEAAPVTKLRKSVPPNVAAALSQALEKLPADRFESAKTFAEALANPAFRHGRGVASATAPGAAEWRGVPAFAPWMVAAVLLVAALWGWLQPRGAAPGLAWQSSLVLPDTASLGLGMDISRDGSAVVYATGVPGASGLLRLRRAGTPSVTTLPGTENGIFPRISPDGRRVAFHVAPSGDIDVVPLDGGAPVQVAAHAQIWAPLVWADGEHLALTNWDGVVEAPVGGGSPPHLALADSSAGGAFLAVLDALPDHGGFIVVVHPRRSLFAPDSARIAVAIPGGTPTVLMPGVDARYSAAGYLVVSRSDGTVVAVPFDPRTRRLTGPATPLATGMRPYFWVALGALAVSDAGRVVSGAPGGSLPKALLVRVTPNGATTPLVPGWIDNFSSVAVVPDGHRVVADIGGGGNGGVLGKQGVVIRNLTSGAVTRVDLPNAGAPTFTPDGRSVLVPAWVPGESAALYRVPVGGGTPEPIWRVSQAASSMAGGHGGDSTAVGWVVEPAVSRDGHTLYVGLSVFGGSAGFTFGTRVLSVDSLDRPGRVLMADVDQIAPSPDGRWLAYLSGGVNVRSTDPARDEVWQVSPTARANTSRRWSRDGRELYYLAGDSLYAARVEAGTTFRVVSHQALFAAGGYAPSFDVMPNGDFVMIQPLSAGSGTTELRMIDDLRAVVGR